MLQKGEVMPSGHLDAPRPQLFSVHHTPAVVESSHHLILMHPLMLRLQRTLIGIRRFWHGVFRKSSEFRSMPCTEALKLLGTYLVSFECCLACSVWKSCTHDLVQKGALSRCIPSVSIRLSQLPQICHLKWARVRTYIVLLVCWYGLDHKCQSSTSSTLLLFSPPQGIYPERAEWKRVVA